MPIEPATNNPDRIVPLKEAAALKGISIDTLRRHYRHQFIRVSTRRMGMHYRDVIANHEVQS